MALEYRTTTSRDSVERRVRSVRRLGTVLLRLGLCLLVCSAVPMTLVLARALDDEYHMSIGGFSGKQAPVRVPPLGSIVVNVKSARHVRLWYVLTSSGLTLLVVSAVLHARASALRRTYV